MSFSMRRNANKGNEMNIRYSPILNAPLLLGEVELQAIHHPLVTDINLKQKKYRNA